MVREDKIRQISDNLLLLPPIIGKNFSDILAKSIISIVKDDISVAHFGIMKILANSKEAHISEVADLLQIPRSQMTHMVDKLEKLKYVCRQMDTSDRRAIKIMLTDSGKHMFQVWVQNTEEIITLFINTLSDEEIDDLAESLGKLRDVIIKILRNHAQYETHLDKSARPQP